MDRDVDEVLRRAIELEYEAMRHHRHHAKDESIAAWERAMALFRDDFAFATRHLGWDDAGIQQDGQVKFTKTRPTDSA